MPGQVVAGAPSRQGSFQGNARSCSPMSTSSTPRMTWRRAGMLQPTVSSWVELVGDGPRSTWRITLRTGPAPSSLEHRAERKEVWSMSAWRLPLVSSANWELSIKYCYSLKLKVDPCGEFSVLGTRLRKWIRSGSCVTWGLQVAVCFCFFQKVCVSPGCNSCFFCESECCLYSGWFSFVSRMQRLLQKKRTWKCTSLTFWTVFWLFSWCNMCFTTKT